MRPWVARLGLIGWTKDAAKRLTDSGLTRSGVDCTILGLVHNALHSSDQLNLFGDPATPAGKLRRLVRSSQWIQDQPAWAESTVRQALDDHHGDRVVALHARK